jgi:perosamine synthetase
MVGATGSPAVFAFYANKQMTTGEGGMLVTDDDDLANRWRSLINQGRADSGQWLEHDIIGYNYRLSDIASAIGVAQVEKLPRMLQLRSQVAERYNELLAAVPGVKTPYQGPAERSWFVYWVVLDDGIDRNDVMQLLTDRGIQCKPYMPCIHTQPAYRDLGFREGMFPVAEDISKRSLALPFHPALTHGEQDRVVDTLVDALDRVGAPA